MGNDLATEMSPRTEIYARPDVYDLEYTGACWNLPVVRAESR